MKADSPDITMNVNGTESRCWAEFRVGRDGFYRVATASRFLDWMKGKTIGEATAILRLMGLGYGFKIPDRGAAPIDYGLVHASYKCTP